MKRKIIRIITNDWKAKILVLLLTFLLWVYVSASQSLIIDFPTEIQVKYENLASDLVSSGNVDSVKIKISTDSVSLQQLKEDSFDASVDLRDLGEGTYEKQIQVVSNNKNAKVVSVSPSKATITIEKSISKEVPIRIKLDGQAADGYIAAETTSSRDTANISGGQHIIESISEVVAPIKVDGEKNDFNRTARLYAYSANGIEIKDVTIDPQEIQADITVSPAGEDKTVGIKVNTTGNVADGYWLSSISTNPTTIVISGSRSILAATKYLETKDIDISNLSEDKTIEVELIIPNGLQAKDASSVQVKIKISQIVQ